MVDIESIETYSPSGKCPATGVAAMVGLGLGAAIVAGLLIHLAARRIYLGVVFPIGMGLTVGAAVMPRTIFKSTKPLRSSQKTLNWNCS